MLANPFLSSKNNPPESFPKPFPRCDVGVPRPLLGEREDVTNWVIRDWRVVAPCGVSVFWKKLKRLVLRFGAGVLALDGAEFFFGNEPAIAEGAPGKSARELRDDRNADEGMASVVSTHVECAKSVAHCSLSIQKKSGQTGNSRGRRDTKSHDLYGFYKTRFILQYSGASKPRLI